MNLAALLLAAADSRPDAVALRTGSESVTFGALTDRVRRFADLLAVDVQPGDRVALLAGNEPAFVTGYLAALWAGAVAVPMNPQAPAPEIAREISTVEPRLVVCGPGATAVVEPVVGAGLVRAIDDDGQVPDQEPMPLVDRADDDVAVLLFTAGTAGAPKAAMLTHRNLGSNIVGVLDHPGLRIHPDDVALGVLPLFHVFGLNVVLGTGLAAGATTVLVPDFHAAEAAVVVAQERVTVVAGVPSMFSAWLELPAAADGSFDSVRLAVSGAAPLPEDVAERFRERFGVAVREGYGLTEASPIVTTTAVDATLRPGSIGPPLPGVEVRLVDAGGDDVLAGDPGEIWVRGPNVFPGYWRDDATTERVLTPDGWLRTGDVAVADDDGYLALVDRAKDLVIVSGFNVYPAEVESVLAEHPDVAEVAVTGVDDPRTGEALVAFVVSAEGGSLSAMALRSFVAARLARYKVPASFELVASLPRNPLGKLMRRALGDRAAPPGSGGVGAVADGAVRPRRAEGHG